MNGDIVGLAARRTADRALENENRVLNEFRDRLARARVQFAHRDDELDLPMAIARGRHRARLREHSIALLRVTTQLHGQGIDVGLPRTVPDGFFHRVDPRVSFRFCIDCDGSVVDSPPCHFGDAS